MTPPGDAFVPGGVEAGGGEDPLESGWAYPKGTANDDAQDVVRTGEGEDDDEDGSPSDAELEALREEARNWGAGVPASRNLIRGRTGTLDPLAPVPLDAGLAAGLHEPAAKEALARLQATRAQLAGQLDALQRYAEGGGILERLKERARALEVRSDDPVWLVVETALDCAVRVTGGLEIFCESLGVYLEYEFTKVKLYDEALARLGGACTGLEVFQAELEATRERLEGFETALEGLQATQAKSMAALPEFSRAMSEPFAKAVEAATRLADKTEASAQQVARFQLWVKAAVGVGAAATGVGVALGWLLLNRPPG
jgi:hypothetical protein